MIYMVAKVPKDQWAKALKCVVLFVEEKSKAAAIRTAKKDAVFMSCGAATGDYKALTASEVADRKTVYL